MTEKIRTCSRKRVDDDSSKYWSNPDGNGSVTVDDIKRRSRCGLFCNEIVITGKGRKKTNNKKKTHKKSICSMVEETSVEVRHFCMVDE